MGLCALTWFCLAGWGSISLLHLGGILQILWTSAGTSLSCVLSAIWFSNMETRLRPGFCTALATELYLLALNLALAVRLLRAHTDRPLESASPGKPNTVRGMALNPLSTSPLPHLNPRRCCTAMTMSLPRALELDYNGPNSLDKCGAEPIARTSHPTPSFYAFESTTDEETNHGSPACMPSPGRRYQFA